MPILAACSKRRRVKEDYLELRVSMRARPNVGRACAVLQGLCCAAGRPIAPHGPQVDEPGEAPSLVVPYT
jgi:hypothetical protein